MGHLLHLYNTIKTFPIIFLHTAPYTMTSLLRFPQAVSLRSCCFHCTPINQHKFKLSLEELIIFIDKTTVSHALAAMNLVLSLQLPFEPPMAATTPSPPSVHLAASFESNPSFLTRLYTTSCAACSFSFSQCH